ncbi:hypothetical protein RN001_003713 [Aquatica leii]|uniref:Uncharacterized protein n=1 Tax=Aquatica leii TaxID=1421715 RepID=A0AAN7PIR2_9COLE|nr:hypothetical protein RN001_003713 [Aquatica leii]
MDAEEVYDADTVMLEETLDYILPESSVSSPSSFAYDVDNLLEDIENNSDEKDREDVICLYIALLLKSTQDDIDFYISQFGVSDFDLIPSALPSTEVLLEVTPAVVALAEVPATSMTGVTVNTTAVSLPSSQTPRLIKSKAAYSKLRLPSEEYRAFRLQKRQKNQEKKKQRGKRVRSVLGSSESVQSPNCTFSPRRQKEATAAVSVSPFFLAPQHEDRSETNEKCTRLSYVSACEVFVHDPTIDNTEENKNTTPTAYEDNEKLHDTTDSNISSAYEDVQKRLRSYRDDIREGLSSPAVQSVLSKFHTLPRTYLTELKADIDNNFDTKYGVREVDYFDPAYEAPAAERYRGQTQEACGADAFDTTKRAQAPSKRVTSFPEPHASSPTSNAVTKLADQNAVGHAHTRLGTTTAEPPYIDVRRAASQHRYASRPTPTRDTFPHPPEERSTQKRQMQGNRSVEEYGQTIEKLLVDLIISQAEGNMKTVKILRGINEKMAINAFAAGLQSGELRTIIKALNYSKLSDVIREAKGEALIDSSPRIFHVVIDSTVSSQTKVLLTPSSNTNGVTSTNSDGRVVVTTYRNGVRSLLITIENIPSPQRSDSASPPYVFDSPSSPESEW